MNEYTQQTSGNITNSGCLGTCTGHVPDAGHAVNCTDDSVPYNITLVYNGRNNVATVFFTRVGSASGKVSMEAFGLYLQEEQAPLSPSDRTSARDQ